MKLSYGIDDMNVGMMQPTFLPWLGYFELIFKSDIFIFLDDFQFSVQSYHQRNRLFVNKGQVDWYTVPVSKSLSFQMPLNNTQINENSSWRVKAWKRIQSNYRKAKYFKTYEDTIRQWLLVTYSNLAEQNISFIKLISNILGINRIFRNSSEAKTQEKRSLHVLELLRWSNAKCYYCANGAFDYMLQDRVFPVNDIEVLFQNFTPKPYFQVGSPDDFVPYLSILDVLLNIGPVQTHNLIVNGTPEWLTWEEMILKKMEESGEK